MKKTDALDAELRSLLIPIDLSPATERVLGRIPLLPLGHAARVTLLHVIPGGLLPAEQRTVERGAIKALAADARHLRQLLRGRAAVETLLKTGAAAEEISKAAVKARAQLIVMGRGTRKPLRDVFLGSTAERVIRQSRVPVLAVRRPPRTAYARPALALDLDQAAREVVRLVLRLLPRPPPSITVIHAFDAPYRGVWYPTLPTNKARARTADLLFEASQRLAKHLATGLAQANVRPEDMPVWRTHVRYGSPRLVVEQFITKAETDLLALGTHGRVGAAHVLLGTVAGDLLRTARSDVLVVPPAA